MQILSRHCRLDVETKETQSYPQGAYNLVDKKDYLQFKVLQITNHTSKKCMD